MKQILECPYCDNGSANLKREKKEIIYRKETFKITEHYYKCNNCQEEFGTKEVDDFNMSQVQNLYRSHHKIPFPEEIKAIRIKYGLSAAKMSEVLQLGTNLYSNYENGEVPTPGYGSYIRAASDPKVFEQLLYKSKDSIPENMFKLAEDKVRNLLYQEALEEKELKRPINWYTDANQFTGFKTPNVEKLGNLIVYLLSNSKLEYNDRLKINKLLFYSDFNHFKRKGESLTGISYRAIPYGPVPSFYDYILSYFQLDGLIDAIWDRDREIFKPIGVFNEAAFSSEELDSIRIVIDKFRDVKGWDLVEISHQEAAWIDLEKSRAIIDYSKYAFDLKAI